MVLSLFGGLGNLRTASAAPAEASPLQVRIVSVSPNSVFVGENFYVNATVANPTAAAITTPATLGISAGATVLDTNPKTLIVPAHGVMDAWWLVQCTAAGNTYLSVTAGNVATAMVVQKAIAVNPKIKVTIIEAPQGTIPVSHNDVIKARVENVSGTDLTGASATLLIDGPGELTNGDVPTIPLTDDGSPYFYAGMHMTVAWNVHCKGPGEVEYTVTAAAAGVTSEQVQEDSRTVQQGPPEIPETPGNLTIQLYSPEKVCTNCGQPSYIVYARVCNNGTTDITDVYATLSLDDGTLATIQPPLTLPIGDLVVIGTEPTPGHALTPASAANPIKFLDLNGNGAWDAGEVLYYDTNNNGTVDALDTRIFAETKYQAAVAPKYDGLTVNWIAMAHDIVDNTTIAISTNAAGLVTGIVTNPVMTVKAYAGVNDFNFATDKITALTKLDIGNDLAFAELAVTAADDAVANTSVIWLNTAAVGYAKDSVVAVSDTDVGIALKLDALLKSTTNPWAAGGAVIRDLVNLTGNTYELPVLAPGECRVVTWSVHPNLPGSVDFTATATGLGGDPIALLTDTDTSTTEQKDIRTDIIDHMEPVVPAPDPPLPPTYQPVLLGDTIVSGVNGDSNLLFPGDPLTTSGGHTFYDVNDNGTFELGTDVEVNDSSYPYGVYNPIALDLFHKVGDKFTITAFVDNCTCLAWPNVLTAITANGLPIPFTALSTDNVKWDPAKMVVDIQKYKRAGGLEGDWELFGSAYSIPVDQIHNPNGNVLDNSMCACCGIMITWHLECNAESNDVIEVKTSSRDTPTVVYDTSSLTVHQGGAPCITTNVQFFKGWLSNSTLETDGTCAVLVGDKVTMVIPVANLGGRTAENIEFVVTMAGNFSYSSYSIEGAYGTVTPDAQSPNYLVHINTLGAHSSAKVIFELTCTGSADLHATLLDGKGNSTITYHDSLDHKTPDPLCQYPSSGTLIQVPLTITWINPGVEIDQDLQTPGVQVEVSTKFAVKISLTNGDPVTDLSNVTVTLHWGATGDGLADHPTLLFDGGSDNHQGAEIWGENQSIIRTLNGPLVHGTTEEVSWEMHCTSLSNVYFWVTVTANAGIDSCAAVSAESHYSYEGVDYVQQRPQAYIIGQILSPKPFSVYGTGDKFAISAEFTNPTSKTATGVVVNVDFGHWSYWASTWRTAAVVASTSPTPEFFTLGDMAPGETRTVTWEMQVVRPTYEFYPGVFEFASIYYTATNGYTEPYHIGGSAPYFIYPAAHLVVSFDTITNPPVGTDFEITGTVRNIGWADATGVTLNMAVAYGDVAPTPGSGMTLSLGLVAAERGGDANPVPFTFNLQAEKVGKVYLVLGVEGRDEYGYSYRIHIQGDDLPENEAWRGFLNRNWFPLGPIPASNIEIPDTLTFNVIDITAPDVAIYTPNGVTQASRTYTIGYGSAAPDVAKYEVKLNDGLWMDNQLNTTFTFTGLVDGVNTLYVRATDWSGNVGPAVSITVIVDVTIPTVTIDPIAGLTAENYGTITYGAAGGTAPYTYRVRLGMGAWTEMSDATSFMYSGLVEGMNVLSVEAKDSLGKTGMAFTYVTLDTTAPTGTVIINGGAAKTNDTEVTLAVDAFDLHGPLEYSTDGLTWSFAAPTAADLSIGDGVKTVKVWFRDVVGNIGYAVGTIVLDTVAPNVAISSDSVTQESTTFTIVYGSAAADVAKYQVKLNAGSWMDNQLNTTYTFYALPLGANTLYVRAVDDAGNTGAWDQIVVTVVDLTAPVTPFANPIGGFYTAPQTVVLNDAEAGVTIYYTLDGTLPTKSSTVYAAPIHIGAGTTVLKAIAADASGNVSDVMTAIYVVNPVSVVSTTLNLANGYNLVSLPFSASINVLGTHITEVYEWTGVLWNAVTTLNPGTGYLVNHTGVETVTASGTATSSPYMTSSIGNWQLIGNPFEVAVPWASVTGSIAEKYSWNGIIWVSATGSMQPGIGYLVRTTSVGSLTFVRP
jgi:hypothetical protein